MGKRNIGLDDDSILPDDAHDVFFGFLPIASPVPTGPADSVASRQISVSGLLNTSAHGQTPMADARADV